MEKDAGRNGYWRARARKREKNGKNGIVSSPVLSGLTVDYTVDCAVLYCSGLTRLQSVLYCIGLSVLY